MKKFSLILAVFIFTPLFLAKAGDEPVLKMDRTFATHPGLVLNFGGLSGDLDIITWANNEVNIKVYANTGAEENMEIQMIDGNGGITINETSRYSSITGKDIRLKYKITLPESYNIEISSSSSDYNISNLTGNISIKTSSGDGNCSNINGDVRIASSSGDLIISNSTGSLDYSTASGDIAASYLDGKAEIKTASGNVVISYLKQYSEVQTANGDIVVVMHEYNPGTSVNTTSGDIYINLGSNVSATLSLETSMGDIIGVTSEKKSKVKVTQDYNGGGNIIECKTTSGDVAVDIGN